MKKRFISIVLALILAVGIIPAFSALPVYAVPERYEHYITGEDGLVRIWTWFSDGNSFTPQVTFTIESVKIKVHREPGGSPGIVTIEIRDLDESLPSVAGIPVGEVLCSGTTNGNTITTNEAGEWREITIVDGTSLLVDVSYAYTVKIASEAYADSIHLHTDGEPSGYNRGHHVHVTDPEPLWTALPNDFMFEIWGSGEPATEPTAQTNSATDVGYNSEHDWFEATLNGKVVDDGGESCNAGFYYRIKGTEGWPSYGALPGTYVTDETFDITLNNLLSETTYEFLAFVWNSSYEEVDNEEDWLAKTETGEILEFSTEYVVSLPIVMTYLYPIVKGETDCQLFGSIGYDGGSLCDAWFEWREQSEENWEEEQSVTNFLNNSGFEDALGDEWVQSGLGTIARSDEKAKSGDYSLKVSYVTGGVQGLQNLEEFERLQTVKVSLGAWVWADEASAGRLQIYDGGVTVHSAWHTGGGDWEWLSIDKVIRGVATRVYGGLVVEAVDAVAYFDDIAFVRGATVSSTGEYSELLETGGDFDTLITGLELGLYYDYRAVAENDEGIGYGAIGEFIVYEDVELAIVETLLCQFVTATGFRMYMLLSYDGGMPCDCRFQYRKQGAGVWKETPWYIAKESPKTLNYNVENMTPETTYEYRAYARNEAGDSYGDIRLVGTYEVVRTPVMKTYEATYIDATTYRVRGAVIYDGGSPCQVWFQWRLLGGDAWETTDISEGVETGYEVNELIQYLTAEYWYEYRVVGENDVGVGFGEIEDFCMVFVELDPEGDPVDPGVIPDKPSKNIFQLLEELLAIWQLNNKMGYWLVIMILMLGTFILARKSEVMRVVFPLGILGLGVVIGWMDLWLIVLLALGAGLAIYGILRHKMSGGGSE